MKKDPNRKRVQRIRKIDPEVPFVTRKDEVIAEPIDLSKPDLPEPGVPGVYLVTPDMTLEQAKVLIKEQGFLYNSLPAYLKTSDMLEIANNWWIEHVGGRLAEQGQLPQQHCLRCNHQWVPRKMDIRFCPKCHSGYWDRPFREKKPKSTPVVKKKSFPIKKIIPVRQHPIEESV